jgi:hypothetical protein
MWFAMTTVPQVTAWTARIAKINFPNAEWEINRQPTGYRLLFNDPFRSQTI